MSRQTGMARQAAGLLHDAPANAPRSIGFSAGATSDAPAGSRHGEGVPEVTRAAPIAVAASSDERAGAASVAPAAWDLPGDVDDVTDIAPPRAESAHLIKDSEGAKPSGRTGGGTGAVGGRTSGASGRPGAAAGREPPRRDPMAPASADAELLGERELKEIERAHPEGLTSVQIVDTFTRRGIRFSEATFRKYVQQGLLPRSRRVGRKGKHQGSMGLYPPSTVRRINVIKGLQSENYTIEEIQRQFLRFSGEIELVEQGLRGLFEGFAEELERPHFDAGAKKQLKKDLSDAQLAAEELLKQLSSIERRVAAPMERPPGGGALGGAEDLL